MLGEDDLDDSSYGDRRRLEFDYSSGEEAGGAHKGREEFKQPVLLSSTASTTSSSSVTSPAHSRSPSISPLSLPHMQRSPQRLNGLAAAAGKGRTNAVNGRAQERRKDMHEETEMKQ